MSGLRFGHLVLRTNRLDAMSRWYCAVLGARVVEETERLRFLTYDDEHHRLALVDDGPLGVRRDDAPGLAHVAFAHGSLADLLGVYETLLASQIEPVRAVSHPRTASLYYRDPDGNEVELFADFTPTSLSSEA